MIYEYREEQVGIEAGRIAVGLVNHLVEPEASPGFDLLAELERLIRLAERLAFGPSTQALIDEAVSRDIPFIHLDHHSLVQFEHDVHQQRIRATMTSKTSAIGVDIASDKNLTNKLLDSAGLPVPRSEVVDQLAFADGTFDKVCFSLVLSYLTSPECVLAELYRVLRPNGSACRPSAAQTPTNCPSCQAGAAPWRRPIA